MKKQVTSSRGISKKNLIYFNKQTVAKAWDSIPSFIKDFYGVETLDPQEGCIRTLKDKVVAIYFWVSSKIQRRPIVKFTLNGDDFVFDSIYIRRELIDKEHFGDMEDSKDYRYDQYNNLIGTYDFGVKSKFCVQHKGKKNTKSYTNFSEPKPANKTLKDCSEKYLNKILDNEELTAFHTTNNPDEIYWGIQ